MWLKQITGLDHYSFETACDEYIKALEVIPSGTVDSDLLNAPVVDFFIVNSTNSSAQIQTNT